MTGFDTQHLSRRQFLQASALGAGALAVTGLGNTALAAPNGAPAFVAEFQTNTLELWFDKWGPDETWTQLWSEVKDKTGITVHETVIPFSDLEAKTLTSLAGGVAPDLIFNHPIFTATWATKGVAIPLDPYLARSDSTITTSSVSDFFQGAMDYNRWNGQIWGLPMDFESTLYYYNKTMLQNAGLQDPGDMWTADHNAWNLDVFADYATRLSSGNADTAIFGAGEIPKSVRVQAPWIWGNGGDLFSPDYSETLINSPGALKAWAFLADHVRKGWSPSVAGRDQPYVGTMTPLFNSSRLAMIYQIRGYLSDLNQELNLGMVPTPTMPNGMQITRCAPDSFSITSKAKDPDAAWAVMQIMIMRGSELLMLAKAASPNRLSLLQSDSWTKALAPWERNDMYQFSMSTARAVPLPPNFNEMDGIVEAGYDQIVLGQASEADAMNNAKSQIDPLLAEAMGR
jgi:multiple sugar transport system substrate-binding protein